jgi:hypothetical protein
VGHSPWLAIAPYLGPTEHGEQAVNNFWKVLTLFFLGAIFVAVMTHAAGFSTAAGTLFTGINTLGSTLEAGGTAQKVK